MKPTHAALILLCGLAVQLPVAIAQNSSLEPTVESVNSFRIAPASVLADKPLFTIERNFEEKGFQGGVVDDVLNFNLGMEYSPFVGLNVRADAWRLQIDEAPVNGTVAMDAQSTLPQLYIEDSSLREFGMENPLLGTNLESNGFDLGASYVWDTSAFGEFTLSTTATYVEEFENNGRVLELNSAELGALNDQVLSPELQSSLMLSWQFGNHTATAITNYIDSFKDLSELDINEVNELVDSITTFDLQYGYSVETGDNDRAIISFGIRNIFDEKTAQLLNSSTRILDQNGRVAYGSIKYQF